MANANHIQELRLRAMREWARTTATYATAILGGAIAARTVMMTIDFVVARNGNHPGGEIFLPIYAVLLLAIGWHLRQEWAKVQRKRKAKRRKELLQ